MKKLILLFLLTASMGFAQNSNEIDTKKLDYYFNLLEKNNRFMGSVSILKNGKQVYNKQVGYQYINEEEKKAANENSKYRIGSITKTFTATMIYQLVDEGKIDVNNKLSQYFPQVPNAEKITIYNLLTHSSGLFNLTNADDFITWMQKPTTSSEMIERISKYDVVFQPNEKNQYSNTNYLLLGYILEKIEGKNYKEILKARITDTLGLKNTYFGKPTDINDNECQSYAYENETWTQSLETHPSVPGGAGAIVSTASDLVLFMNALFNGKLVSAKSFETMTTVTTNEYCSGLFKTTKGGKTLFAHEGSIDGFHAMLVYIPQNKIAIAVTANALNYQLMQIVINTFMTSIGVDFMMPNFSKIELTDVQVQQYIGDYKSDEVPFKLIFKAKGNILVGAPEGSNLKDLVPTKKNQFTFDTLGIILDFNPEEKTVLFTRADNKPILFTKI